MSAELRFLKKLDGTKILQVRNSYEVDHGSWDWSEWEDVPMLEEIKVKDEIFITKPYEQAVTG